MSDTQPVAPSAPTPPEDDPGGTSTPEDGPAPQAAAQGVAPGQPAFQPDGVDTGPVGLDPALAAARDAARAADPTPATYRGDPTPVVDPEGRFAAAREDTLRREGVQVDVRDGAATDVE